MNVVEVIRVNLNPSPNRFGRHRAIPFEAVFGAFTRRYACVKEFLPLTPFGASVPCRMIAHPRDKSTRPRGRELQPASPLSYCARVSLPGVSRRVCATGSSPAHGKYIADLEECVAELYTRFEAGRLIPIGADIVLADVEVGPCSRCDASVSAHWCADMGATLHG